MAGNMPRLKNPLAYDTVSLYSAPYTNVSGNMPRWKTSPAYDSASQYSATYSDISVDDKMRNPDIGQRLHSLFEKQLYTDVKFVLSSGGKPKPTLLAHRAILSIGSNKFREMFYGSNSQSDCSEIQINNIQFDAFRNVVEYLYTDDVIFENDQIVLDTLSAAATFQVQPLVDKCESYIELVELTEDNVCSKLQMAISRSLSSLKMRCIEFIQENTGAVLRSDDILSVNPSTVRTICKLEKFNLRSEMDLLSGIVRYVENRPDYKMDRRAGIDSFLRHIRILNVSCDEFTQFVQKMPNVFTAPEATNILMTLANPANPAPNLPSWCKRGNSRCSQTGPRARERPQDINICRKLQIQLKPSKPPVTVTDLVCLLEMKCLRGNYKLEGLKLSFADPVLNTSFIDDMIINVEVKPSGYHFEEHINIEQSKHVEFNFSKKLLAKKGHVIYIRAVAKEAYNYKFLQFDEDNSVAQDSPFACSLGSVPKENRLFVISEVRYRDAPTDPPSHRRRPGKRR